MAHWMVAQLERSSAVILAGWMVDQSAGCSVERWAFWKAVWWVVWKVEKMVEMWVAMWVVIKVELTVALTVAWLAGVKAA